MAHTRIADTIERAVGHTGLFLMLIIARLATPGYAHDDSAAGRASGWLARRAIDVIAGAGWLADRLLPPPPATRGAEVRVHAAVPGPPARGAARRHAAPSLSR